MFIEEVLNESYNNFYYDIEPTNEGYDNMTTVIMEDIEDTKKLNLALEAVDYMMLKETLDSQYVNEGVGDVVGKIKEYIRSAIKKIKELIQKMWSKIKEVFNTIKLKVFSVTNIDKFISLAEKELKNLSDFKGVEIDGFHYSLHEGVTAIDKIDSESAAYIKKCRQEFAHAFVSSAVKTFNDEKMGSNEKEAARKLVQDMAKQVSKVAKDSEFKKEVIKKAIGVDESKMNDEVFKKLRSGKNIKRTLKISSPSAALSYLKEYKQTCSDVAALETSTNEAYSNSLKELDEIESVIKPEGAGNTLLSIVQNIAKLSKVRDDLVNRVINLTLSAAKECKSQATMIVQKCISQGRKNKKESDNDLNESTDLLSSIMGRI